MNVSSTTATSSASGNTAQIAALERELAKFEKQLQTDETSGGSAANTAAAQLIATQIALVETEIAALSKTPATPATTATASATASKSGNSRLGNTIDVTV